MVYEKGSDYEQIVRVAFCVVSGKYLTVAGLVLLAIRSFAIEIFSFPPENNYIAPAGRVMEPEEETFSFAAASDTGAKNAPIERIVKQAPGRRQPFFALSRRFGALPQYQSFSLDCFRVGRKT